MTTGTNALLAKLRQTLKRGSQKRNSTTNEPSLVGTTNVPQKRYRIHVRRICYQCRQEGHYARDCPRTITPKPTETRVEKMRLLLKSMTPIERAQFKRETSLQMRTMQAHLRTMTTLELEEFKRQIVPSTAQTSVTTLNNRKTPTNPLSRETSPCTNQTFTESSPSRETGPHPSKSVKKLAQALKKRIRHEAERRTYVSEPDPSFETYVKSLKSSTQTPHPDSLMRKLADALKRHSRRKE